MPGKKFRFSLASVLRLRQHESEQARQGLAHALRARQAQEARVADARTYLDEVTGLAPPSHPFTPDALRRQHGFRKDALQALDAALRKLERLKKLEEKARANLQDQQRAEKTMQTLHDEEHQQHVDQSIHEETAFLDEQALMGYLRKQQSS